MITDRPTKVRNAGWVCFGLGIGLAMAPALTAQDDMAYRLYPVGLLLALWGNILTAYRSSEEKMANYERRQAKYVELTAKYGNDKLNTVFLWAILLSFVMFGVTLTCIILGKMPYAIVGAVVLAAAFTVLMKLEKPAHP